MGISVGETLDGRYRLTREISRGPRSLVFEGQHLLTKRAVAIKLPVARAAQASDATDLLLVEARLLTEARHPCVVQALDAGKVRSGALSTQTSSYLVMEMLEARPLSGVITSRGQLSLMDTLRVGLSLCDALSSIHRAGIVHGDLRPGNVFVQLSRQGAYDPPIRLIDFGAAASAVIGASPIAHLRERGFLSPEQRRGEPATGASDIYGLAALLYECLTGRLPFPGPHFHRAGDQLVAPIKLRPGMPAPMSDALVRALSSDPEERFGDAGELGRVLKSRAVTTAASQSVSSGAVPGSAQEPAFAASDAPASSLTRGLSEPPEIEIRVVDVAADSIPKPRRVTDPYFGAETRKAKQAPAPKSAQTATPLHDSRRIHRRASYLTPVHVLREGGHGFDARCEDISEGGMLLIGPQVIEDAESIEVRFALPITGEVVTTPATSRWVRAAREGRGAIGVQFLDLSPAARENIANYVQFFSYDA